MEHDNAPGRQTFTDPGVQPEGDGVHSAAGTTQRQRNWSPMKMAKAIRQQAATAERVAVNTADNYVANQMRSLAQAFRTQAEIIKKNKKKKKK